MKSKAFLLSLLLISLSIFGQGVTYSPFVQPYQVTYVGSGGGSGIPTQDGIGTNLTVYGSTVNNTPQQILGYNGQASNLLQVGQLGALGNKLFVVGPDGKLYGDGSGLTNIVGTSSSTNTMISISTNIVLNTIYSNNFGGALNVFIPMTYTVAAVNGNADLTLVVPGFTNYTLGASTAIGVTIAMTYQGVIAGSVPAGFGFYVTNNSTGVGNSATMNGAVWSYATNIVGINISGAQVTSGTVADARLSGNVPLLNAANVFTAAQTIPVTSIVGGNGAGLTNASHAIIQGGSGTSITQQATGSSEYVTLGIPAMAGQTSINTAKFRLPYTCTYTNLQVSDDTGFGVGTNVVITIFTNGIASNMQISLNGAGTAAPFSVSNLTTSLTVPANCYMNINFSNNSASAPAAQLLNWNIEVLR